MSLQAAILGFPRIGARRELKKATEAYWKGEVAEAALLETAAELRARHWRLMAEAGIDVIPSNDFSFYDQVLDISRLVGNVPERFGHQGGPVDLDLYFRMARGADGIPACEMTKWFDTNYHYIVPEFGPETGFSLSSSHVVDAYKEARALGIETRPVLVGPLSYLWLGKERVENADGTAETADRTSQLRLLDQLVAVYADILKELAAAGCRAVQIDEPILALDLEPAYTERFVPAYGHLSETVPAIAITVATYFEGLRDNLATAAALPVAGLHVDLVRAPDQLEAVAAAWPQEKLLSLGVINGRNIWRADLAAILDRIEPIKAARPNLHIATSCSLLHTPIDLDQEEKLDEELKGWMAFAKQKLGEVATLTQALAHGREHVEAILQDASKAAASHKSSTRLHKAEVKARTAGVTPADLKRRSPFAERRQAQIAHLNLPAFPTTTIGSFPQTRDIRQHRAAFKRGELTQSQYEKAMEEAITETVRYQEEAGLDVLVHGEFERNDMVEYFGEQLDGFAFTQHGWVQSYGSRYVKPPVIFGDVSRPEPMTVRWSAYGQSITERHMKGMLTGPVTMLMWSFVRDDQPRSETCKQIALAIRDEVADLEAAGIQLIQIDEPAFREGLPLRQADRAGYLRWAVDAFRLSSAPVRDTTQIHTHMCYSEFNDIIDSIADLDADVISIETSRSDMELLDAFVSFKYPNEIGPGVWDIHSPRVPSVEEMRNLLLKATDVLEPWQIWVNPDCGLKTRGWPEVKASLHNMVEAAKDLRQSHAKAA